MLFLSFSVSEVFGVVYAACGHVLVLLKRSVFLVCLAESWNLSKAVVYFFKEYASCFADDFSAQSTVVIQNLFLF